jgi:hypothetical protein
LLHGPILLNNGSGVKQGVDFLVIILTIWVKKNKQYDLRNVGDNGTISQRGID